MIVFSLFLITVLILGYFALFIIGFNNTLSRKKYGNGLVNGEQLIHVLPVVNVFPKGQIKDSRWFVKTFLRPRKK